MITAICFAKKSQWILVGTYDGRCIVFETEKLAFYTEFKQASDRPVTGFLTKVIYLQIKIENDRFSSQFDVFVH